MKARLLLLVLSSLLLSSCAAGSTGSHVKETTVVGGNSQFTPAGIAEIKSSPAAVFDFTQRPLQMPQLGFDEESDGAMVATDTSRPIRVSMTTPNGLVEMETDTIRIRPGADNIVDHIDIFVTHPDVPAANRSFTKQPTNSVSLCSAKLNCSTPEREAAHGPRNGTRAWATRTGTVYSVEIYSAPDTGWSTFIYSVHLADEYYTPEASAKIGATGKL